MSSEILKLFSRKNCYTFPNCAKSSCDDEFAKNCQASNNFLQFLTKRESSQVFMANCVISKPDDSKIKMIKSWWLLFCSRYVNLAHISYVRQVPVMYFQEFFWRMEKNLLKMTQFVNSCPLQTCTSSTHCQKGSKINNAQFFTLWW